jgi:hypothetical protein
MRELAKALSDESSVYALIEKTALHLKHLAELIDAPINMILINAEPNTKN